MRTLTSLSEPCLITPSCIIHNTASTARSALQHTAAALTLCPFVKYSACCHLKKKISLHHSLCFWFCSSQKRSFIFVLLLPTVSLPYNSYGQKVTRGQKFSSIIIFTTESDLERFARVTLSQQIMIPR